MSDTQETRTLFGTYEDHPFDDLSLDNLLITNPSSSFYFKASGEAMSPYIMDGDLLLIDRSILVTDNSIAIIQWEGEFLCRQLCKNQSDGTWIIKALKGKSFKCSDSNLVTFGKVKAVVRQCLF